MGIQNEIDRINSNISDTYDNLETLGATMPSVLNSNNLPNTVNSVVVVKDVKDSVTGVSFVDANRVAQLNIDGKVDKVASPVTGNVATLTNDGNIEDSGYGIQQASEVSIVYSISSSSTNNQVPSALSVYNYIDQHGGGTITDVTVDGTSVVEDGVAKIISPTITDQDVKTALGYTPYNATNPDGYQTSSQVNTAITNHNTSNAAHDDIRTALSGKQANLVSGTNIKTVNNNSLLGSGNLAVQDILVSGTNIKTINDSSILGEGNIDIQGGGLTAEIEPLSGNNNKLVLTQGE